MAVAKSNSYIEPPSNLCTCYKVSDLRETILNPNKTARLSDRYILREQLGWGQFGVIRECVDKFSGELLACKSISKDRLVTREDIKSIKLEIQIMTELSGHPNVVDLKAVYEEEDYVHLVMELCAGGELFHKLEKHGRFSELEAQVIFRHLMQVVLYCHEKGVVHRDLKPENILLATKSSCSPIKLADFGLATYISPDHSWLTNIHSLPTDVHKGRERNCELDLAQNRPYSLMSRNLDISFGTGSALISEIKSDSFACKSSFSSFLAAPPLMPSLGTFGFSFQSNVSSSAHENSIPLISLPSFTFFGERENDALNVPVDSSGARLIPGATSTITKAVDDSKVSGSREVAILGIHSRRNHTIGVSEIEHLTESVIRWASCTRLPTATSLRSSLVC
ncbi:calcium-dependent protein kinase [Striga asiatica]|uniref:non-specific serine/threonine protein kinase n=1 Tax=Striga asiatica TaxID=4170 RepID=A0A5A7NXT3_STRAF|nr:calcium-dependent protein kinase [Striga asiatica]